MVMTPTKTQPEEQTEMAGPGAAGFDSSDDEEGELDLSPFQISWFDVGLSDCEKLGISGLPGCRFKNTWRSLSNDIKCLQTEGVEEVFSLCTKGELNKYRVPWLLRELAAADITVHHYPFPDGQVPQLTNLLKMIDEIHVCLQNNKKPIVHCYGGLGRSCLAVTHRCYNALNVFCQRYSNCYYMYKLALCAMLVFDESVDPEEAIKKVRELRGPGAVQSVKQYNFISDFRAVHEEYKKDNATDQRSISR